MPAAGRDGCDVSRQLGSVGLNQDATEQHEQTTTASMSRYVRLKQGNSRRRCCTDTKGLVNLNLCSFESERVDLLSCTELVPNLTCETLTDQIL